MNPGIYNLGDSAIGSAVTGTVITRGTSAGGVSEEFIGDLDGIANVALQVNFTYGSGGTTLKVTVETSLDQGLSWIEIARFAFTTVSGERVMNLPGDTAKLTPYTPVALSDDMAVAGILGDRLRAKITSTGTYAGNSSVSVRAAVR